MTARVRTKCCLTKGSGYANNLHDFGNALYSGVIGSPVDDYSANWLVNVLSGVQPQGPLASELAERLLQGNTSEVSKGKMVNPGTKGVILVKGRSNRIEENRIQ